MAPSIWNVALLHFLNILKLNGAAAAAAPGDADVAASAACVLAVTGTDCGCADDDDAVDGCVGGRVDVDAGRPAAAAAAAPAAACMSFADNGSVDRDPLCEDMARWRRWQLAILALRSLSVCMCVYFHFV